MSDVEDRDREAEIAEVRAQKVLEIEKDPRVREADVEVDPLAEMTDENVQELPKSIDVTDPDRKVRLIREFERS